MAIRQKEKTNKFLEITDPKKAVGLWSYYTVRETAMTPVGATKEALGRFLPQDVARWKRREEMAAAMEAGRRVPGARTKFKSPARIIAEYQEKAKQDTKRLKITEWQMKYRWLHLWERYACRLTAPSIVAGERDTQMFFGLASAGVCCHEGNLHGGRVFFLRKKVGERNSSFCASLTSGKDSASPLAVADESTTNYQPPTTNYNYFVAVVLKPGGTKWWYSLERVNVTWTTNTYDRLIIDPRGKLEWSPMDAEVLTERVVEKDVCLFQLEDDALFAAITDNELNPNEKYAHLCYDFDFFCRNPEGKVKVEGEGEQRNSSFCAPHIASPLELAPLGGYSLTSGKDSPRIAPPSELASLGGYASPLKNAPATCNLQPATSFYMRWSVFFNPKKSKFNLVAKSRPRVIEVMGERKKGWIARPLAVSDEFGVKSEELRAAGFKNGKRKPVSMDREAAKKIRTSDAKLGLGDTPLDLYAQEVAHWVVENNGCAVLPVGVSREMRLALSHALFFVTFPDRRPDEEGGILRGYQLPGRLVEHAPGKVRGDNGKALKERSQKQSEEATARRRKMVVDCLFARACAAVLARNNGSVLNADASHTQNLAKTDLATTPRPVDFSCQSNDYSVEAEATPESVFAKVASNGVDGNGAKRSCGVARADKTKIPSAGVVAAQVSPNSAYDEGICVLKITEQTIVPIMDEIGARRIIEKAAWQRGFMEGNPLMLFRPSPTAGNLKLPDLSLALGFEHLLGLKGETAGAADLLVQTAPIRSLRESQGPIRESFADAYPCQSLWTPAPGKEKGTVAYPSDSVRILRDEGRYYLMAMPKYALYRYERDLVFEPDVPGKARPSTKHPAPSTKPPSVPVNAYSFKSVGGKRSRADSFIVEEKFDYNKVTKLAREGRLLLYAIDFGQDKWLADIVFSKENKQPCKIVPTIPILAPVGAEKKDALQAGRKNGTDMMTNVAVTSEAARAFITFTFNPTVARDNRKVEGRSWKGYCDAFPAEEGRHIVRLADRSIEGLRAALQEVIESDGVLLTDKEHIAEAIRAATYVVKGDPYNGYNLKDRIFKDSDGRVEWRAKRSGESGKAESFPLEKGEHPQKKAELNAKYDAQRKELKGKPLCEVLSPDLAREAEAEFTRQIEADTLVDAKTPKTFKLDEPIKVGEDFRDAVAREFRRISYTGTMGWRQKLNRPAHEVAVGIWLAGL